MNSLKAEIKNHILSLFFFSVLFAVLIYLFHNSNDENSYATIEEFLDKTGLNIEDDLDRAIISDGIRNFYGNNEKSEIFLNKLEEYRNLVLTTNKNSLTAYSQKLNTKVAESIFFKWINFIFFFVISGAFLFYFSESFALLKLKLVNAGKTSFFYEFKYLGDKIEKSRGVALFRLYLKVVKIVLSAIIEVLAYFVLFSPVYIVAYAFKFNYGNISFFAFLLLTLFTNGILVVSVNKFYMLLYSEFRKGYVLTEKIKGSKIKLTSEDGIFLRRIFSLRKSFGEHTLSQVYLNSHRQFILHFKETARFLITGIVIVELSLNIQNGLFYEMLQSLMRREFDILFFIILLVFVSVKLNDILITYFYYRENAKYENR